MSIDNLLAANGGDVELELQYNQMVDEAEQSIISLEDVLNGLSEISNEVSGEGVICKTQAVALESIAPGTLPRHAPINSFTQIPSKTNLKVALEEIDKKKVGIIAAIVLAAGTFLYKLWKWISGKSEDTDKAFTGIADKSELVAKAEATFKEATHELQQKGVDIHAVEAAVRKDEHVQKELFMVSEHYTETVHLFITNPDKSFGALNKMIGALSNCPMIIKDMEAILHGYSQELSKFLNPVLSGETPTGEAVKEIHKFDHVVGPINMTAMYGSFAGIDAIKGFLVEAGMAPADPKIPVLDPAPKYTSDNKPMEPVDQKQHEYNDQVDSLLLWLRATAQFVNQKNSTINNLNGYVEVERTLSNVNVFTSKAKTTAMMAKNLDKLDSLTEMYSDSAVRARVDRIPDNESGANQLRVAEKLVVKYAQCVAALVQLVRTIINHLRHFLDSAANYQKSRKKSLVEKSKAWIKEKWGPQDPKAALADEVFEMLVSDTVSN
jgi:hypothetical protein